MSKGELEVEDVDILEDRKCAEEALHEHPADLYEWVQGLIETGATLVQLAPVRLIGQAVMDEGIAFEASKTHGVFGLTETGKGALLLVEVLDDGIGAVGGDVLLHHILLLLAGGWLHANSAINYYNPHCTHPHPFI